MGMAFILPFTFSYIFEVSLVIPAMAIVYALKLPHSMIPLLFINNDYIDTRNSVRILILVCLIILGLILSFNIKELFIVLVSMLLLISGALFDISMTYLQS